MADESTKRKRFMMMMPRHHERNLRRNSRIENGGGGERETTNGEHATFGDITDFVNSKTDFDENELNFPTAFPPEPKKSRGRPQKQQWTHEWSDKATEALIELWSVKEELYNKQHPEFYMKESKDRAIQEIKNDLNDRGFDVTENNILSKFQSLRTYFCTQRTKFTPVKKSNSSYVVGGMMGEEGESKWRFYKSLMFLDDNMKQRDLSQRRNSDFKNEYEMPPPSFAVRSMEVHPFREYEQPTLDYLRDSSEINGFVHHNNNSSEEQPVSDHIKVEKNNAVSPVQTSVGGVSSNKHEDILFGELVGNMIHKLPAGQHKDMIKLDIQQLIIRAKYASNNPIDQNQQQQHQQQQQQQQLQQQQQQHQQHQQQQQQQLINDTLNNT